VAVVGEHAAVLTRIVSGRRRVLSAVEGIHAQAHGRSVTAPDAAA
jgi:hypothetical protein